MPVLALGAATYCVAWPWLKHGKMPRGQATFVTAIDSPALEARLKSQGIDTTRLSVRPGSTDDARQTEQLVHQKAASWVVVDGCQFDVEYQRRIKEGGVPLLLVDDNGVC